MSGTGWLWLCADPYKYLGIIPTYGTGTLLASNRHQSEEVDRLYELESPKSRPVSGKPAHLSEIFKDHGLVYFHPLLCLSVHEHAWLLDYGIWGKSDYIANFWNVIDWAHIEATYSSIAKLSDPAILQSDGDVRRPKFG